MFRERGLIFRSLAYESATLTTELPGPSPACGSSGVMQDFELLPHIMTFEFEVHIDKSVKGVRRRDKVRIGWF